MCRKAERCIESYYLFSNIVMGDALYGDLPPTKDGAAALDSGSNADDLLQQKAETVRLSLDRGGDCDDKVAPKLYQEGETGEKAKKDTSLREPKKVAINLLLPSSLRRKTGSGRKRKQYASAHQGTHSPGLQQQSPFAPAIRAKESALELTKATPKNSLVSFDASIADEYSPFKPHDFSKIAEARHMREWKAREKEDMQRMVAVQENLRRRVAQERRQEMLSAARDGTLRNNNNKPASSGGRGRALLVPSWLAKKE